MSTNTIERPSLSNVALQTWRVGAELWESLHCYGHGEVFSRVAERGRKPFACPDCKSKGIVINSAPVSTEPVTVPTVANVPAPSPMPANPRHFRYSLILAILKAGIHVYLVGPAGSGKSTIADQIADDMGLTCYAVSGHELMTAYDLMGFTKPDGDMVVTLMARAIEFGGLFLFDELDALNSSCLMAFNAIAAKARGSKVWIGDREVTIHDDFYVIAGGNTFGRGANGAYVARQVLDAASLDRFATVSFGYDAVLEYLSCGVPVPAHVPANPRYKRGTPANDETVTEWVTEVRRYRDALAASGIDDTLITPRASQMGAKMLRAGIHKDYAVETLLKRGLSADEWRTVKAHLPVAV